MMTTESTPGALGSNAQLGLVPERAALAPCPFCGERPRLTLRPDDAEALTYFAAVACYCGGYSACAHKMATAPTADEAEAKVRAAWNCRA
jgi:Lar family restriction alleviation protein